MRRWVLPIALGSFLVLVFVPNGAPRADFLPLHGLPGLHLDPFTSPCAVSLGPPCGVLVAPLSASPAQIGADAFVGGLWHVQDEINFLTPTPVVIPTFVNGVGPFPVTYGGPAGTTFGLILDGHFDDTNIAGPAVDGAGNCNAGAGLEVGAVCRQLLNLTPFVAAWGTAVEEGPLGFEPGPVVPPEGSFFFSYDPLDMRPFIELNFDPSGNLFVITKTPSATSLVLVASGAVILGRRWFQRRRRDAHSPSAS